MIGVLNYNNNNCTLKETSSKKEMPVHPEQYVYVHVSNAWIPALLKYSKEQHNWYFAYLPELPVNGCKVMTR